MKKLTLIVITAGPHMKRKGRRQWVLCAALLASLIGLHAQNYAVDWSKIAGGGGTSTGDVYSVSSTIGQPDAGGPMTNGQYSVVSGFWVLGVVQVTNAPTLTLSRTATNTIVLAWPNPPAGFVLQQNTALHAAEWSDVVAASVVNGEKEEVTLPLPAGTRFYRLRR